MRKKAPELWKKSIDYLLGVGKVDSQRLLEHVPKQEAERMMSTLEKVRAEGIETGIEKGKIEAARAMLRKGYPLTDVIEITGLTEEQLEDAGINGKTAI